MTSHHRRDNDSSMFTSKTPHFFKVILPEAIRDGKLGIPRNFIRKHGKWLSSPIQLEVPSGAMWQVELIESDEGVWLQKGWQEFVKHHSLECGYFVVFRYDGNAHFHVFIFDRSASEINYPYTTSTDDLVNDTSVELCDNVPANSKSREKSHLQCPRPSKKIRTESANQIGINLKLKVSSSSISRGDPKSGRIKLENLTKVSGQPDGKAAKGAGGITARKNLVTDVLSCVQPLTDAERAHAVQIASAFKSTENPVFMVVMKPSFVRSRYIMVIPLNFSRKFLTRQKGDLTLWDSTGKTWPAKYCRTADNKKPKAYLYGGWRAFAVDNNLKVGDICVFELVKHPEILMKVIIYPVVENASKASRPLANGSRASQVKTRRLVSDTEPNFRRRHCSSSSRDFKNSKIEPRKRTRTNPSKKELMSNMEPVTLTKDERAFIEASAFKSANPSFIVLMQPSYVLSGSPLHIPNQFSKRYLKENGEAILRLSARRTWVVDYKRKGSSAKFVFLSDGWRAFMLDNNLKVGDICAFQLIKENEIELDVVIFSAADVASCSS